MDPDRRKKASEPTGPYAPPLPSEAQRKEAQPMAVAGDMQTPHDAFMPTSSDPENTLARDVAERWRQVPERARSNEETETQERAPPDMTDVDDRGFRRLRDDAEDTARAPGEPMRKSAFRDLPEGTDEDSA